MIPALTECTGRLFTAATRRKQRCCDNLIDEKGTFIIGSIQEDKFNWLLLFLF
jgi:hypothetical protein